MCICATRLNIQKWIAQLWKAENIGFYSIKSAYQLCVEVVTDSSHLRRGGFWQGIWRLKVPPKIRNLIWRICRNVVPTRRRLHDKGVQCPLTCVACNDSGEDLDHLFFNCPFTMQVWQRLGLWTTIQQTRNNTGSVAECIFALLQHYNADNSQRFTVTLWSLWKHRNLKLWQDVDESATQVIDRVHHLIEDWQSANSVTQDAAPPRAIPHGVQRDGNNTAPRSMAWQRPPRGRLKCNIDASFSESLIKLV
jgi:hypothetical protein